MPGRDDRLSSQFAQLLQSMITVYGFLSLRANGSSLTTKVRGHFPGRNSYVIAGSRG